MPKLYLIANPKPGKIRLFYTIDAAVGAGCANARKDVQLVQFFLRVLCDEAKPSDLVLSSTVKRPLKIDGAWGQNSQAYLKAWEKQMAASGGSVLQDGKVDSMTLGTTAGPVTGNRYKMALMNGRYSIARSVEMHMNLASDPLFPGELASSFYVVTTI